GLVRVLGVVEVVGRVESVRRIEHRIELPEDGRGVGGVINRVALLLLCPLSWECVVTVVASRLIATRAEEVEQRSALAFDAAVDLRLVRGIGDDGDVDRACAQGLTEVGSLEVLVDVFEGAEEEHPVAFEWAAPSPS